MYDTLQRSVEIDSLFLEKFYSCQSIGTFLLSSPLFERFGMQLKLEFPKPPNFFFEAELEISQWF